jgi:effector-binding domain-containing protein
MEVRETKKQNTICIKTTTPVEKLPEVFGKGYAEIMETAGKQGVQPTGAPYALYLNDDMSNLRIEFGFPAARPIENEGRVEPGEIPGGRAAYDIHEGPYDTIGDAYNRLMAFIKEKGLEPTGISYEVYLNDPTDTPPEELKTEIYFPLK